MIDQTRTCPWCLYTSDAGAAEAEINVCTECAVPSIVDDDAIGGLRKPTRREHETLAADRTVVAMIATILTAKDRLG